MWNFKQVIVYYREQDGKWVESKAWNDLFDNRTREEVIQHREKWQKLLLNVIVHLNSLFIEQVITTVPVLASAESIAEDIAEKFSDELADFYLGLGDRTLEVFIKRWFETELLEFSSKKGTNVSLKEKTKIYSKNILINWINRITFSNFIKDRHNVVNDALNYLLDESRSFDEIAKQFNLATKTSDFYTILHCDNQDVILSDNAQLVIREYASFLEKKQFNNIDQKEFQTTLESIVEVSKRELMGLYTTPKKLASLLVKSSVSNLNSYFIDPCVGSGTIVNVAMSLYENAKGIKKAHNQVWAADKYKMPLQVANISMSSKESLNLPNVIFQKDLLSLSSLKSVKIVNPDDGETVNVNVPAFDFVVSNLPFIRSERIDEAEKDRMKEINEYLKLKNIPILNLKNDWYEFGIIAIERILKDSGVAAVITSNSWLKTKKKKNYIQTLFKLFEVKKIIISGQGRWFQNADVVTTIIILSKSESNNNNVQFIKINKELNSLSSKEIENISDSILIGTIDDNLSAENYTQSEINSFIQNGLSLNVLFNDMSWFKKILPKTVPMKNIFEGKRGVKSTNDGFFYDPDSSYNIEPQYTRELLKTPTSVNGFYARADAKVFFVRKTKEELNKISSGAYNYINRFENQPKTQSQMQLNVWYQYPEPVYGDFVTSLNPDQRLFWSMLSDNIIVNQRLTVFKVIDDDNVDKQLLHALLNSYFGQFMISHRVWKRSRGARYN
ncbi:hypothetical protein EEI45_00710 [Erysipelothrix piscisicarius]|uniref:DNA methylase adenine-specific domain-containing protein n=1 Tax=Erysipelothrix piscisicarius TaxID=2485784 RepID=A0A3S5HJY4_9FIRM|nr:N-6 DNA methylase [Erysipelothrix piscisicarius]AZK43524.1 hypothetical protein EEI45_00710 [Erysipelothrix piscisicarius]